jgi:hypothetical protein
MPGCGSSAAIASSMIMMCRLFAARAVPRCRLTMKAARCAEETPPQQVSRSRSTTKIWSETGFSPSNRSRKSAWWNQLTQAR